MRTACLSTGLKEWDHVFEKFAAAVIILGELRFAVRRQSTFAVRFQFCVSRQYYYKENFRPSHSDRTHKRSPPVSILDQPNPVHIPTSHILEIHRNVIHPSTPRSPEWSPSLRFPQHDPIHPPFLTHTRHMSSTSHSSRFYHPHNIR